MSGRALGRWPARVEVDLDLFRRVREMERRLASLELRHRALVIALDDLLADPPVGVNMAERLEVLRARVESRLEAAR